MYALRRPLLPLLLALPLLGAPGCSDRVEIASGGPDSTTVHPAKDPGGVEASIVFYRAESKKSDRLLGEGRFFTIKEDSKVRARVNLFHANALGDREGMFHLVWVDPEGKAFYTKRIDYNPDAEEGALSSSVSATPGRRDPGEYMLRVYLYRELIAEKSFVLLTEEEAAARAKAEKAAESGSSKKKSSGKKRSAKKSGSSKK
ncbi:MAG: hypothetical protein JW958_01760 [Candidatus Eisenbacteria bacterium]|nr:hypothetical protein [Candidatus Eisenbacteria bacterium]